jgi:hypothetical protein
MGAVSPRRFLAAMNDMIPKVMEQAKNPGITEGERASAIVCYTACYRMVMQPGGLDWLQTQIVPFDFQFFIPEEMKAFGRELCDNEIVPLPAPYTLLNWKEYITGPLGENPRDLGGSSHCLVVDLGGRDWLDVLNDPSLPKSDRHLLLIGMTGLNGMLGLDTFAIVNAAQTTKVRAGQLGAIIAPLGTFLYHEYLAKIGGNPKLNLAEAKHADTDAITTWATVLGCLGLLTSKVVKISPPPEREVEKRLGHPAPDRRQRPAVIVNLADELRREHQGGTHASPIPHFRRGHVRRLHRDDEQKLVVVSPTIVNARDEAKPDLKPYIVKRQGQQ